jgi:hypothetical protein
MTHAFQLARQMLRVGAVHLATVRPDVVVHRSTHAGFF